MGENKQIAISRQAALDALDDVVYDCAMSQRALHDALVARNVTDRRDRALATELVFGVLRWLDTLDATLEQFADRGLDILDITTLNALRIATYQILRLDRVPNHAAVYDAVAQVRERHEEARARFTNAILRKVVDLPPPEEKEITESVRSLSAHFSHPKWVVRSLRDLPLEVSWTDLCKAYSEPAPAVVRIREAHRQDVEAWLKEASEAEISKGTEPLAILLPGGIDPIDCKPFKEGWWIPQDEGSQTVVRLAQIEKGHRVLDLCAGTGTKTTQLGDAVGKTGAVVASDISGRKLRDLRELMTRWGLECDTLAADGTKALPLPKESFDRVILDAPCSGVGTIRRRPEIKWRRVPDDVHEMTELQKHMLQNAALLVKAGGLLTYSVCSFTNEEGPQIVEAFLKNNPDYTLEKSPAPDGYHRTHPLQGNMDGFFIAVLRKQG